MVQFIAESLVIAFISMVLAVGIAHLLLPFFNLITEKQIAISFNTPEFILVMIAIAIGTGVLAGLYPAFYLSAFAPTKILKSSKIKLLKISPEPIG